MKFGLGQSAPRVEDQRLLTGGGRYTDDHNIAGQLHMHVVRSPYPHARIVTIGQDEALSSPGVVAVLQHADLQRDGIGTIPCYGPRLVPLQRPNGEPIFEPDYPALADDVVRYAGQPVAIVIAETAAEAKDAAERVDIDYEALEPCIDTASAADGEQSTVWPQCPRNICFQIKMGNSDGVNQALQKAAHITRLRLPFSRVCTNAMEPRAALGDYDAFSDRYTLYSGNQNPHDLRHWIAKSVLKIAENQLRIVSPDMGGAFGLRAAIFPELVLVLWASKRVSRPVKWLGERSEMMVAEDQSRDMVLDIALGLADDGEFLGLDIKSVAACGAFLSYFAPLPAFGNMGGAAGTYRTPFIHVDVTGVFTHTAPICPYRGAGRPEAAQAIEQIIDLAARQTGIDRIALRRRNFIAPEQMPFQTGLTYRYDCGEFEANMDTALQLIDYAGFETRREHAHARGKLRGIAVINAIEQAAGMLDEGAEIRFDPGGGCTIFMGLHSHGQGHETVFRQLLSDRLGLEFEQIRYVQGDTDLVPYGHGTGGSRGSGLGGAALARAADMIIEKGKRITAATLEASVDDVSFAGGRFTIAGTDLGMELREVVNVAFDPKVRPVQEDGGLQAFATYKPSGPTFPNACHACELEVDPQTGVSEVLSYFVIEDVGTMMNPRLIIGQLQGGVVQGFGQIMMEQVVYGDDGQQLSGSFMDYCMPRADDVPFCTVKFNPVPTKTNPLGIKGVGEAGTVGSMPVVMNALLDALQPLGVTDLHMPATPHRIWQAIQAAQSIGPSANKLKQSAN